MFVLQDTPIEFKALEARLKVVAEQLLADIPKSCAATKLSASQTIFPSEVHNGAIFVLKEGVISHSVLGTVLFHYEAGEIIGLEHLAAQRSNSVIATDFAVVVDAYSGVALLQACRINPAAGLLLQEYLTGQAQLLAILCQTLLKQNAESAPEIRAFAAGDEIFLEGSEALEVFNLVEGEAEAIVDGVAVGRVMPGELFGVVAALAGTTRTATVRATKHCTVLVIAKDNFSQLIESRPATVLRMVEEMARTLVSSESAMSQVSLSRF